MESSALTLFQNTVEKVKLYCQTLDWLMNGGRVREVR